uniref:Retrotransposon gag domain-containing protein n=1 Tax=Tanacetum cinerariifolium TaxID=118510 RepID=A0A699H374_TANCI|nr:hypothetical protein [Tanacetum cinerariifolium]
MEYLVKISKKARILELKQRHLKITVQTSNTSYPSRTIWRICACTSLKTTKDQGSICRDPWDQRVRTYIIGRDVVSGLLVYELPLSSKWNSSYLGLRKKYRLSLKNDMPPRDNGSNHEDVNEHIEKVLEIVDLFCVPNITQEPVMLRAFPMSLTGAMNRCLRNKPSGSITTWEDLKIKFLSKYCPPACTTKKMEEINNFQQEPDETHYQA